MTTRYDRWEYHVEGCEHPEADRLNALGGEGWRLVAVHTDGSLIFSRAAPDLRERITLEQRDAVAADRRETGR